MSKAYQGRPPLWQLIQQECPDRTKAECQQAADKLARCHRDILYRCNNPESRGYERYGGRGITVCAEWADAGTGAVAFVRWALGAGWAPGLEIDRVDNDGNYEPDNCRWVTHIINCYNRGITHIRTIPIPARIVRQWVGCNGTTWSTLLNGGTEAITNELIRQRELQNAEQAERTERLRRGRCPICGEQTAHVLRVKAGNGHRVIVGCPACLSYDDIYFAAVDAGAIKG